MFGRKNNAPLPLAGTDAPHPRVQLQVLPDGGLGPQNVVLGAVAQPPQGRGVHAPHTLPSHPHLSDKTFS